MLILFTYNYANDAAIIFLNMDDEGKVGPIDNVGRRGAHIVNIILH